MRSRSALLFCLGGLALVISGTTNVLQATTSAPPSNDLPAGRPLSIGPGPLALLVSTPTPAPTVTATPTPKPTPKFTPNPPLRPWSGPAPLVYNGPRTRKIIAITIDDCFSVDAVRADLAILKAQKVNATFFPIGHVAALSPSLWHSIAAAGFPVANHTYDHANLTRYTYAQIVADIKQDNTLLTKIIGGPPAPFVRPMGGSWNSTVLAAAAAAGERYVVNWDTTDGDTASAPGRTEVDLLVRNAIRGTNGSIILMHANLPYTQQALPLIIAYYRARGFTFVTLGQMFGVPGPVPFPPTT